MISMGKKKVLLIDDEADFCFLVKKNLERVTDYNILTATSGKEGIRLAKQYEPDLILLDIMMPEMDGSEVAEVLLEDAATCKIPIVFLTAVVQKQDLMGQTGKSGGRSFIAKPVTLEELVKAIKYYLGEEGS